MDTLAVFGRRTGTSPATSPPSILWSMLDLNGHPLVPKPSPYGHDVHDESAASERIAERIAAEEVYLVDTGEFGRKTQEAYAALDATQGKDYIVVKKNVLAYELVPEAYYQQLRSLLQFVSHS
ncbi:hypothetical protein GBF38_007744 [Nibea albiflora]|uniref:Uncharacterized protein n=1 Tax=Nibea albiflora TaxID=240163 RepID=A0ACB7ESG3_NIBAL|nr:hypothetical protein GBF38_007744 [Nibea albiflora]